MADRIKLDLLTIGDELLLGIRQNGHLAYLGELLARHGVTIRRNLVVRDDPAEIRRAFVEAWNDADIIITTGGLGPTIDDNTRETVADALGLELVYAPEVEAAILERFRRMKREMSPLNRKQCFHPEDSDLLPNAHGTAPGIYLQKDGKTLVMLPGPSHELRPMFMRQVLPRFQSEGLLGDGESFLQLRTFGLGESAVNESLQGIFRDNPGLEAAFCVHNGIVDVRLAGDPAAFPADRIRAIGRQCREILGENFFTFGNEGLGKVIFDLLRTNGHTLSVAESCTGGMLAHAFTNIPGVSKVFAGGAVCYKNDAKVQLLGVPEDIIAQHGAVSAEVAVAMAVGAAERFETDYAISTTGFAGPGGGDDENPVGSVFIGYHSPGGTWSLRAIFPGGRNVVQGRAVNAALDMARRKILQFKVEDFLRHTNITGTEWKKAPFSSRN